MFVLQRIRMSNPSLKSLRSAMFFSGSTLDRVGVQRTDASAIEAFLSDDTTRFVVFNKDQPLLRFMPGHTSIPSLSEAYSHRLDPAHQPLRIAWLSRADVEPFVFGAEKDKCQLVLLGQGAVAGEDRAHFALDVTQAPAKEGTRQGGVQDCPSHFPFALSDVLVGDASFMSMRPAAFFVTRHDASVLAQAASMIEWHARSGFCSVCGTKTESADAGHRRVCGNTSCRTHKGIYNTCHPRTDAVVITLVLSPDRTHVLAGHRKLMPRSMYTCIAGFLEPGETLEEAVRREVKEETGVLVDDVHYQCSQPWPFPSSLMIGCIAHATTTEIKAEDDELDDIKWVARSDLARALDADPGRNPPLSWPPHFAIANRLARAYLHQSASKL